MNDKNIKINWSKFWKRISSKSQNQLVWKISDGEKILIQIEIERLLKIKSKEYRKLIWGEVKKLNEVKK